MKTGTLLIVAAVGAFLYHRAKARASTGAGPDATAPAARAYGGDAPLPVVERVPDAPAAPLPLADDRATIARPDDGLVLW